MLGLKLIYVSQWGLWKPDPPLSTIHTLLHTVNPTKYVHFFALILCIFAIWFWCLHVSIITVKSLFQVAPNPETFMIILSPCPIHYSQVLSRRWRYSLKGADKRCSKYIWVISKLLRCDLYQRSDGKLTRERNHNKTKHNKLVLIYFVNLVWNDGRFVSLT